MTASTTIPPVPVSERVCRLQLPVQTAASPLDALCGSNLLEVRVGSTLLFRCMPLDAELAQAVDELVELYRHEPVAIIKLIAGSAIDRIRNCAARTFSEAFRLKRGTKQGKRDG